jgi:hypothetical protein
MSSANNLWFPAKIELKVVIHFRKSKLSWLCETDPFHETRAGHLIHPLLRPSSPESFLTVLHWWIPMVVLTSLLLLLSIATVYLPQNIYSLKQIFGQYDPEGFALTIMYMFLLLMPLGTFVPTALASHNRATLVFSESWNTIKRSAHTDVVEETVIKLADGVPSIALWLDTHLPTLRNRTVDWTLTAFRELLNPEFVRKVHFWSSNNLVNDTWNKFIQAWEMYCAGDFNLLYKSLTSPQMLDALCKLPLTDPEFFAELVQAGSSDVPELPKEISEDEVSELDNDDFMGDGSEVPLAVMVKCVAGDDIGEDLARNEEGGTDST